MSGMEDENWGHEETLLLLFALTIVVMVATRGTFSTLTNPSPLLPIDACPRFLTNLPDACLKDHSLGDLGWNPDRTSVFKFSIILMLTFTKCTIVAVIHRSLNTLRRESHLGSPSLVTKRWIDPDLFITNLANVLGRGLSLVVHHTKIEEDISLCEFGYPTPSKSIPITKKPSQNVTSISFSK